MRKTPTCGMCTHGPNKYTGKTEQPCKGIYGRFRVDDMRSACAIFCNAEEFCRFCKTNLSLCETVRGKGICQKCFMESNKKNAMSESYGGSLWRKLGGVLANVVKIKQVKK